MTPEQIDRVFGRGRLRMATGEHVEVYREAVAPGERRRYTKRFLDTGECDFAQWTEREWRILARLIGHGIRCVPDVVQFDGGGGGGIRLVQTYDAGVTVDQWATLLPVARNGRVLRHVFEDCAHWWALAHHCLGALDEIHRLSLVHLDIKGDNLCIPFGPTSFEPDVAGARLYPIFARLALIDFAFSLVSRESLAAPLPIGWQKDYDYQSPRLLAALEAGRAGDIEPTMELDWRCDLYSLAAMLKRYLPDETRAHAADDDAFGWTPSRYDDAKTLIFRIRDAHDRDFPHWRPHQELMEATGARLREHDLAASLDDGWTLARDAAVETSSSPITPMTRIAPSLHATHVSPLVTQVVAPTAITVIAAPLRATAPKRTRRRVHAIAATLVAAAAVAAPSFLGNPLHPIADDLRALVDRLRPPSAPAAAAASDADRPGNETPTTNENPDASGASPSGATDAGSPAASAAPAPAAAQDAAARPASTEATSTAAPAAPASQASPAPVRAGSPASHSKIARSPSPEPHNAAHHPPPSHPSAQGRPKPPDTPQNPRLAASSRAPVHVAHTTAAAQATPRAIAAYIASLPKASTGVPSTQAAPSAPATRQAASEAPREASTEPGPARAATAPPAPAAMPSATSGPVHAGTPTTPSRAAPTSSRPQDDLRSRLSSLWRTLRGRDQPPAPVEERSAQSSPTAAGTALRVVPPIGAAQAATTPPLQIAGSAAQPPTPAAQTPQVATAPSSWTPPSPAEAPPPDYAAQARRMLVESVPRVAAQAQADVSRVLWIATNASMPSQELDVIEAARARWASEAVAGAPSASPAYARQMQDTARHAFASGGDIDRAIDAQMRAFGADPRDADVASFLAYLQLRASPPRAEAARELALYAIAVRGPARTSRVDDWQTFAIASALAGRNHDARMALYASMALGRNLDRTCRSALSAFANYGEPMRAPVEAMLYRLHVQGRENESPYCAWPPDWALVSRAQ